MASPVGNATLIQANGTVSPLARNGILKRIVIGTYGSTNTVSLYDDPTTTNNLFAVIDTTSGDKTLWFDVVLRTGLTVVTAGGTAAKFTVIVE